MSDPEYRYAVRSPITGLWPMRDEEAAIKAWAPGLELVRQLDGESQWVAYLPTRSDANPEEE